jgi:phospholipid/cholesterol/gamma-HCH transport system substrate-binding protein
MKADLGLFFALAVVLALVILEYLGSFGFLHRGYHLHALFKNVQDLKKGDPVKMAGVQVGRVENIILTNGSVDVTMKIDQGTDIRTTAKPASASPA